MSDLYEPSEGESAADIYQSLLISHQVGLLRVSNATAQNVIALLNQSEEKLLEKLHRELEKLGAVNALNYSSKLKRIQEMILAVQRIRAEAWLRAQELAVTELEGVGTWEVDWNKKAIDYSVGVALDVKGLTLAKVKGIVSKQPFQGRLLAGWFQSLSDTDQQRVSTVIQQGLVEGLNAEAMARQLSGTRANGYRDGLFEITRRQANSVVRTAVNHIANRTREDVWAANSDIISAVQWVSVLDGRTTAICRSRDGKYAPLPGAKDTLPPGLPRLKPRGVRPPAHFNCRSLMVAVLDPEGVSAKIGVRPYVRSTKTREGREVDFRVLARQQQGEQWSSLSRKERQSAVRQVRREWAEQNVGRAPASTTYPEWLKKQPLSFQQDVLGKTRAALFNRGGLTVDSFVDSVTGREWTLKELRRRESAAFQKAGL